MPPVPQLVHEDAGERERESESEIRRRGCNEVVVPGLHREAGLDRDEQCGGKKYGVPREEAARNSQRVPETFAI